LFFFIVLFSLFNQWIRWLPTYLSSVMLEQCEELCSEVPFTPICESCSVSDPEFQACSACLECRTFNHHEFYNLQDGTCMSTNDYGVLTGFGFSLTFGLCGVIAGYIIDKRSESFSAKILGLFSLLCGLITFLTSICTNFDQILILRSLLGGFQAFIAPVTVALISSNFESSSEKLIANGAYTIGVYMGAGLSSLTTLAAVKIGWKLATKFVGYLCIISSIAYALVLDTDILFLTKDRNADADECEETMPILTNYDHSTISAKAQLRDSDFYAGDEDEYPLITEQQTAKRHRLLQDDDPSSNTSTCLSQFNFKSVREVLFSGSAESNTLLLLLFGSCVRFSAGIVMFVYIPISITRKFSDEVKHHRYLFSVYNLFFFFSLLCIQ